MATMMEKTYGDEADPVGVVCWWMYQATIPQTTPAKKNWTSLKMRISRLVVARDLTLTMLRETMIGASLNEENSTLGAYADDVLVERWWWLGKPDLIKEARLGTSLVDSTRS